MKLTTENTEMEWRDASVTLPDDGYTVIIHTLDGEVWTGFIDGDVWRNVLGNRIHEEEAVLHWMPLPWPPKETKPHELVAHNTLATEVATCGAEVEAMAATTRKEAK